MDFNVRAADDTSVRRLDGLVLFWLVLWVVIGGWTGYTLWQLSDLGDTVSISGHAIGSTGEALQSLGGVPVVGDRTSKLGGEVVSAGNDIAQRGQAVRSEGRQLAILLGLAIALLPATTVLGLYLPMRAARRRDVAEARRLVSTSTDRAVADRHLAERAVRRLPFAAVQQVEADPWRALAEGRTRALADAELSRLGVQRPRV